MARIQSARLRLQAVVHRDIFPLPALCRQKLGTSNVQFCLTSCPRSYALFEVLAARCRAGFASLTSVFQLKSRSLRLLFILFKSRQLPANMGLQCYDPRSKASAPWTPPHPFCRSFLTVPSTSRSTATELQQSHHRLARQLAFTGISPNLAKLVCARWPLMATEQQGLFYLDLVLNFFISYRDTKAGGPIVSLVACHATLLSLRVVFALCILFGRKKC